MDFSGELPPGLRAPAGGEPISITWRAQIGSGARVGDLAAHLQDLETAVLLGERWGTALARAAAYQQLLNRIFREGPRAIEQLADRLGYPARDLFELDEWLHSGRWPGPPFRRPGRAPYGDPTTVLQALADIDMPGLLGSRPRVRHASYENPLELILTASGFAIAGVVAVLRLARDWSNTRRLGAAEADQAEADARTRHARADGEETRGDLTQWLVNEAKAGRVAIPIGELLGAVGPSDDAALRRLADHPLELEAPAELDPPAG